MKANIFFFRQLALTPGLLLLALLLAFPATAMAQSEQQDTWQMATRDADIQEFVAQVAKITGKTFIVDPKLKGKVNVISETPLGKQGVYELFLSVLRLQNYTAIPSGNVIRIQQSATGKQTPGGVAGLGNAAPEELVTEIIALQNVKSDELLKILRPLIPQYGHIGSVTDPNVLILSDHADNISRLKRIIEDIDVVDTDEVVMHSLKEAWVGNIVAILEKVAPEQVGASAKGPQRVQVIANERNNSLVMRGQARSIANLLQIIEGLDQPATASESTQVIFLDHADAENVSSILQSILGSSRTNGGEQGGAQAISIQADTTLNAIVVRADPSTMNDVQGLVKRLDTPRAQVLIEAAIVEVTIQENFNAGIEVAAGDQGGSRVPLVSTSLDGNIAALLAGAVDTATGDTINVLQGLASLTGPTLAAAQIDLDGVSFGAVISALASNSDANLLSTPSIVTLDNVEAKILVGREVPFRTGSFTTTGDGTSNPFTTVSREDVGVELLVTPHVFGKKEVRLEVSQNITNVLNTQVGGTTFADVVTSKRAIETTVLAADGETIVLGGLIQDDISDTERRVPLLGGIPVVGNLFKSRTNSRSKTNLLVFLRPTILEDTKSGSRLALEKYNGIWEVGANSNADIPEVEQSGEHGRASNLDGLFDGRKPE